MKIIKVQEIIQIIHHKLRVIIQIISTIIIIIIIVHNLAHNNLISN